MINTDACASMETFLIFQFSFSEGEWNNLVWSLFLYYKKQIILSALNNIYLNFKISTSSSQTIPFQFLYFLSRPNWVGQTFAKSLWSVSAEVSEVKYTLPAMLCFDPRMNFAVLCVLLILKLYQISLAKTPLKTRQRLSSRCGLINVLVCPWFNFNCCLFIYLFADNILSTEKHLSEGNFAGAACPEYIHLYQKP